jgi:hypothetical protein
VGYRWPATDANAYAYSIANANRVTYSQSDRVLDDIANCVSYTYRITYTYDSVYLNCSKSAW